ncbi:unnamed protein product [Spirodela intermedia]|uniref:Uncharacterized protein n=1 Tax=Spirodela intermedia TaxID=51605 RepID=A0ABN7E9C8_SPIIN|nr:unnamed protein product [Spirodela intermedia]
MQRVDIKRPRTRPLFWRARVRRARTDRQPRAHRTRPAAAHQRQPARTSGSRARRWRVARRTARAGTAVAARARVRTRHGATGDPKGTCRRHSARRGLAKATGRRARRRSSTVLSFPHLPKAGSPQMQRVDIKRPRTRPLFWRARVRRARTDRQPRARRRVPRLQRILPAPDRNNTPGRTRRRFRRRGCAPDTGPWEPRGLLLRDGNWAAGRGAAASWDSDLEAFSRNPTHEITLREHPRGPSQCFVLIKQSDSLVRTSSEPTVRRPGKAPARPPAAPRGRAAGAAGAAPGPSPAGTRRPALAARAARAVRRQPTGSGPPGPSPQSQSFSRGYGSILPTSLAYILPSTRCSPWRPDAVMSTTGRGRHSVLRIFKGRRGRAGRDVRRSSGRWTLPPAEPFPGWAGR